MTVEEIAKKIRSLSGWDYFVVIKDTEKGGMCRTQASYNNIMSGGGVLYVVDISSVLCNNVKIDYCTTGTVEDLAEIIKNKWDESSGIKWDNTACRY